MIIQEYNEFKYDFIHNLEPYEILNLYMDTNPDNYVGYLDDNFYDVIYGGSKSSLVEDIIFSTTFNVRDLYVKYGTYLDTSDTLDDLIDMEDLVNFHNRYIFDEYLKYVEIEIENLLENNNISLSDLYEIECYMEDNFKVKHLYTNDFNYYKELIDNSYNLK